MGGCRGHPLHPLQFQLLIGSSSFSRIVTSSSGVLLRHEFLEYCSQVNGLILGLRQVKFVRTGKENSRSGAEISHSPDTLAFVSSASILQRRRPANAEVPKMSSYVSSSFCLHVRLLVLRCCCPSLPLINASGGGKFAQDQRLGLGGGILTSDILLYRRKSCDG